MSRAEFDKFVARQKAQAAAARGVDAKARRKEWLDQIEALYERLNEASLASSFSVMAMLEALFRVDYLHRNYRKLKDQISRDFRMLHKQRGSKVSWEDHILDVWKAHTEHQRMIGDLRGALRFRHWVAHGRYWRPKLGRAYDFPAIHALAEAVLATFPLENAA